MLYHLLFPLADDISVFNLFRYLTFRTGGAVLTALILSFMLGAPMIRLLKNQQVDRRLAMCPSPAVSDLLGVLAISRLVMLQHALTEMEKRPVERFEAMKV